MLLRIVTLEGPTMIRRARYVERLLLLGTLGLVCGACSEDTSSGAPGTGSTPPVAGGDPGAAGSVPANWPELNLDCPEAVGPFDGVGAPRGQCCMRSEPNSVRVASAGPGNVDISYRMVSQVQTNHPDSLSLAVIEGINTSAIDNEEQSLVLRLDMPQMAGEPVSGRGSLTIGQGRYNCDGTYSYFGAGVAPVRTAFPGAGDPSRWQSYTVPIDYDPTKTGADALRTPFAEVYRGPWYTTFFNPDNLEVEWELVLREFRILRFDLSSGGLDCQGSRQGSTWNPGFEFAVFMTLADNHHGQANGIPDLGFQSSAQLVAFGLVPTEMGLGNDPLGARCAPQLGLPQEMRTCPWVKLPEYLCPETDAERGLFGCHSGVQDNADGFPTNCTMTPPATPRDETAPDEGQCCDPLGNAASGLPACNAFMIRTVATLAAAKIASEDGGLPQKCL